MIQRQLISNAKKFATSQLKTDLQSFRYFCAAPAAAAKEPKAAAKTTAASPSAAPKKSSNVTVRSWARSGLEKTEQLLPDPLGPGYIVITDETLTTPSVKVSNLADEILGLSKEDRDRVFTLLEERIGFASREIVTQVVENGGVMPGGDGAGQAGAAAEAPKEEKTSFNLKLGAVDAKAKIKVIKEVRTITGLGLKEAKELVEKAPVVLKEGLKKEEAEAFIKLLADAGAEAKME